MAVALSMDACTPRSYVIAQKYFTNSAKLMLCLREKANTRPLKCSEAATARVL